MAINKVYVSQKVAAEDMNWDEEGEALSHPCRCGGSYRVAKEQLEQEEKIIVPCENCSFNIQVLLE
jgi:diphthamide biosynthesis protein 4